jgi:Putative ABC exporter
VTTLGALFYADVRSFVNQLREIRRSPARALMWLLFAALVCALIALRIFNAAHGGMHRPLTGNRSVLDVIASLTIAVLGVALATGDRYAGLFAHPAEARFIIDSPAEPFVATLYVQTRQIVRGGARQAIGLLYFAVVYLPATLPASALVRDLVLLCVALAFIAAVPLARQLLPPRLIPLAATAGVACIVAALLVLARVGAETIFGRVPGADALASRLPPWQPGDILIAGPREGLTAIALLLLATAVLFAYVAYRARDAYPELYELSMKRFARTERLRSRPFGWAVRAPQSAVRPVRLESTAHGAPAGVAIFIWRAWTEYRRTNSARSTSIETALALIGGYAVALLVRLIDTETLIAVASPLVNIVFILAVMRSTSLAAELRRPLFWLSDATLFEGLCALGVAQGWRLIGWCALAGIGLAAGGAGLPTVVAALVLGPSTILLAGAIGYASYALLPNDIDQRGPLLFVRLLLGYALIVPPVAAGLAFGLLEHTVTPALLVAGATTLLEAAVLAGFAAWRLDRMSIALR